MKFKSACLAFAITFSAVSGPIAAQEKVSAYPSKNIMIVVPLAAGGAGGAEAILYCQSLSQNLGRPCQVDYRPGAGTTLGTTYVVKSKPDGYTLIASSPSLTIAPAFYNDLPYDVTQDLTPITQMSQRATVVVVSPSFPANNIPEFVAYMKANPGKVNWGSAGGSGSMLHLLGAWLQDVTNTKMTIIQYKGSGEMNTDLIAGRIDATAFTFISATPLLKAGKIRAIGLSSAKRSPLLPEMRTVQEQGVPDFEYPSWLSILAPARMDPALQAKLHAEFVKVALSSEVRKVMEPTGTTMVAGSSADLSKLLVSEIARWKKITQAANIKLEE
jgi:tripartite-type tricarboxylate transporter receptor subunit TctC